MEFVTVRCRPFYLPWEFPTVLIIRVYFYPSTKAKGALCKLYRALSELANSHPDELFIVSVDFNHANLKSELQKFHQYVDFPMIEADTLDLVYTNLLSAYRSHLGSSDYISVMLIPAYRPFVMLLMLKVGENLASGSCLCSSALFWEHFQGGCNRLWQHLPGGVPIICGQRHQQVH